MVMDSDSESDETEGRRCTCVDVCGGLGWFLSFFGAVVVIELIFGIVYVVSVELQFFCGIALFVESMVAIWLHERSLARWFAVVRRVDEECSDLPSYTESVQPDPENDGCIVYARGCAETVSALQVQFLTMPLGHPVVEQQGLMMNAAVGCTEISAVAPPNSLSLKVIIAEYTGNSRHAWNYTLLQEDAREIQLCGFVLTSCTCKDFIQALRWEGSCSVDLAPYQQVLGGSLHTGLGHDGHQRLYLGSADPKTPQVGDRYLQVSYIPRTNVSVIGVQTELSHTHAHAYTLRKVLYAQHFCCGFPREPESNDSADDDDTAEYFEGGCVSGGTGMLFIKVGECDAKTLVEQQLAKHFMLDLRCCHGLFFTGPSVLRFVAWVCMMSGSVFSLQFLSNLGAKLCNSSGCMHDSFDTTTSSGAAIFGLTWVMALPTAGLSFAVGAAWLCEAPRLAALWLSVAAAALGSLGYAFMVQ